MKILIILFVFQAAEAVMQQNYPSIIAWHESQPETKKYLEVTVLFNYLHTDMIGTYFYHMIN